MGIYKTIRDNDISITLQQSQKADTYMYFDANEVLTYAQIILDGLQSTIPTVESATNLLDYFAAKRIASFSAVVTSVKEAEQQETLRQLVDAASTRVKAFSVGEIIKLINRDYRTLIVRRDSDENVREIFFPLVEFCIKYQSGISDEVFTYLATEHWFVFFCYYDDLKKKLLSSSSLYEKVFAEDNIKNLMRSKCEKILEIAKSLSVNKQESDCFALLNTRIITISLEILKTVEDRELLSYGDSMRRVRRYFSEIDYDQKVLGEFEEAYKLFDMRLNEYLDKHGSVFSQEIPPDIADKIFGSDVEWITKLLLMTHTLKEGRIISHFTYKDSEEPSFVDQVSNNIDTDEYFSYSKQHKIQCAASVGTALIMQIFCNQSYREDFVLWITAVLDAIIEYKNIEDENLTTDLLAIEQALQFVEVARKTKESECCWSLVYGACMLIIACIEKVLRVVYKSENNVVLSDELIQLGPLLSNGAVEKVLTTDLMKGVGFYLSKYGYVGLNYRNRLAHLSNIKVNEIPSSLPYTLLYLYTCVINGVFIHYCGNEKREQEKQ